MSSPTWNAGRTSDVIATDEAIIRHIRPARGLSFELRDIAEFRELFLTLASRSIRARYKQTVGGILWATAPPLVTGFVFTMIFSRLAQLPSDGVPYLLLVLSGVVPWMLFANCLSGTASSIVGHAAIIRKIWFPRVIVPVSSCIAALFDFAIAFAAFLLILLYFVLFRDFDAPSALRLLVLPPLVLMGATAALGLGFWFAALNATFRDVQRAIPFILQIGVFISPVGFSTALIPDGWRWVYSINPMATVIDGFRWALVDGGHALGLFEILVSIVVTGLLFVSGLLFFNRLERTFADVI